MRFIDKRTVCKALHRRRHNPPQTDVDAKKAWRRFNKKAIRKACYKQQQGLCAYTELSLDDEQLGFHLEHIAPRSRYPERTFAMDNIILAALDDRYVGQLETNEQFGGHFKKAQYDDTWFIGPFDARCEVLFQYCAQTGQVFANDKATLHDQAAIEKTIAALNLNCAYLVDMRKQQLVILSDKIQKTIQHASSSLTEQQDNLQQLKKTELGVKENKLPVFFSAKKQLFDKAEQQVFQKTLHH